MIDGVANTLEFGSLGDLDYQLHTANTIWDGSPVN
jgi:hypothetical protein